MTTHKTSLGTEETADLVGWARRASLHDPNPATSRKILGTALGVRPAVLAAFTDAEVAKALSRLRGLAEHAESLASVAEIDDLTKALRRGAGMTALQREVDRARRHKASALSVLFIDVDGLKEVNDRSGHAAGDTLLLGVVSAIRDRLRSYDLVIRYGGDEFICGLSDVDNANARRLAAEISRSVLAGTRSGVTIGIATLAAEETLESVIARADHDLYQQRASLSAANRR